MVVITALDEKLLVAIPGQVWNRAVSKRKLASRALVKATPVAVAACHIGKRFEEKDIVSQLRVWVGCLQPGVRGTVGLRSTGSPRSSLWPRWRCRVGAVWRRLGGGSSGAFCLPDSRSQTSEERKDPAIGWTSSRPLWVHCKRL